MRHTSCMHRIARSSILGRRRELCICALTKMIDGAGLHQQSSCCVGPWQPLNTPLPVSRLPKKAGNKDSAADKYPNRLEECLELYNGQIMKY